MPAKYQHHPQKPLSKRKNPDEIKEQKEVSNFELFQLIEMMRAENKQGIDCLNNELGSKITGIRLLISDMQKRIEDLETKIQKANTKADEALKLAYQNKAAINMLFQNILRNKMEISGSSIDSNLKGEKLTLKVKELVNSFGVALNDREITRTFQRPRKGPAAPAVVIEFKSFDTKMKLLKARKIAKNSKIYFDNSLTPLNRFLMFKAREVAKDKNFSVFLSGDKVHVKKDYATKLAIIDISDILEIKSWIPNPIETTLRQQETNASYKSQSLS
ncbi:hypothetical protein ACKWTF_012016 [Chironomus riparius]